MTVVVVEEEEEESSLLQAAEVSPAERSYRFGLASVLKHMLMKPAPQPARVVPMIMIMRLSCGARRAKRRVEM